MCLEGLQYEAFRYRHVPERLGRLGRVHDATLHLGEDWQILIIYERSHVWALIVGWRLKCQRTLYCANARVGARMASFAYWIYRLSTFKCLSDASRVVWSIAVINFFIARQMVEALSSSTMARGPTSNLKISNRMGANWSWRLGRELHTPIDPHFALNGER